MSLRRPLTVAELTGIIRGVISMSPELEDVLVEGEISNLSLPSSGHLYFTLKDGGAALGCVVWRSQRLQIPFRPANGMTVIVHGRIEVYDAQGRYQLYADRVEPSGVGALALAVEQRRQALAAEGLFDAARKRRLPLLPRRVVVVTSRTGAALRDVLTVLGRRAPCVEVVVSPATVQGEGAAETLVLALERAQLVAGAEVVLLVRGGGSLEDLMAFNDEGLARAVRGSRLPVVCGVGHETDTTLADLAADRRAASPSAAAEMVAPDSRRLAAELAGRRGRLSAAGARGLHARREAVERLRSRLENASPLRRLPSHRQEMDARAARLRAALSAAVMGKRRELERAGGRLRLVSPGQRLDLERERLARRGRRLSDLTGSAVEGRRHGVAVRRAQLEALSPLAVLDRGYSITMDGATRAVLTEAAAARPGQVLRTRLARGTVVSTVREADGEGAGAGSTAEPERMYDPGDGTPERG
ncbi:MAG: exodeoxyribonuclease VII large subunit [Candidatus Dormibacteria bacterium]